MCPGGTLEYIIEQALGYPIKQIMSYAMPNILLNNNSDFDSMTTFHRQPRVRDWLLPKNPSSTKSPSHARVCIVCLSKSYTCSLQLPYSLHPTFLPFSLTTSLLNHLIPSETGIIQHPAFPQSQASKIYSTIHLKPPPPETPPSFPPFQSALHKPVLSHRQPKQVQ